MSQYISLLDLKELLSQRLASNTPTLLAIDGCSASGKSHLAHELSLLYDCNLFHMDDFFLQSHQRTPERLLEPGGNVDYERFHTEVILPLREKRSFSYRIFDCQSMTFAKINSVQPKLLNIIEGSYSHHPYFQQPYDITLFLEVDAEEQSRRILHRNGEYLHKRFMEEWIPMENRYFEYYKIRETSQYLYCES